jgi:hypothetical protein
MYTYVVKDKQGNWFLSQWKFSSAKAAEEDAAHIAEYDFIDLVKIVKCDSSEIKNLKPRLN